MVMVQLMVEVAVDWVKHAFAVRNSGLDPASVYGAMTGVLCRDVVHSSVHRGRKRKRRSKSKTKGVTAIDINMGVDQKGYAVKQVKDAGTTSATCTTAGVSRDAKEAHNNGGESASFARDPTELASRRLGLSQLSMCCLILYVIGDTMWIKGGYTSWVSYAYACLPKLVVIYPVLLVVKVILSLGLSTYARHRLSKRPLDKAGEGMLLQFRHIVSSRKR
ncbi:membrane protein,Tapt1/CMV receptor [Kipferlia bialata]|uniref:Membrane protein,Tapt1/CMV receptor n=1 Tax=Kipferlia bialata TaxID=797122 RepID=A0A9K3GKL1_9EUKA|nr:membrane protein,Tapt1/CMV receptor [Kipferlia bialata]|eukprot:g7441.t1